VTLDELDRLWAAVERLRGQARGGRQAFNGAGEEYDDLVAAVRGTLNLPVADVARASGLSKGRILDLRRRAKPPGS